MFFNFKIQSQKRHKFIPILLVLFFFCVAKKEAHSQRISSYLTCDYNVGGGISIAYLTDATIDAKYLVGVKFTSEAQNTYKSSLTFQASYFQPVTEELVVPIGIYNPGDFEYDLSFRKATITQTYSNFSFGKKYYLTGSFSEKNSIYVLWDIGFGIGKNKFIIEDFDPNKQESRYFEAYNYHRSILLFGAAGCGYRKKIDNYEFFWELKGHYFIDIPYLENKYNSYQPENVLEQQVLVKSIPNYYAINIGARIII
jgi:hypothetical protein